MTKIAKYYFNLLILLIMFMTDDRPGLFVLFGMLLLIVNFIVDDKQ